jgi:hypothetical protein
METGYDYLLIKRRFPRHIFEVAAIFLVSLGVLMLAGGGAYYVYAAQARAELEAMNTSEATPVLAAAAQPEPAPPPAAQEEIVPAPQPDPPPAIPQDAIANQDLGLGEPVEAGALNDPWSYEPLARYNKTFAADFLSITKEQGLPIGRGLAATRITVAGLGIDSSVEELGIIDLGDSRAYEAPVRAVGHIPETANAGEAGSAWFFGHLESPVVGEGSVFYHLPEIAQLLDEGEEVFVVTQNGANQYLYRMTGTRVVTQEQLELYDSGRSTIHLVTCVPRLVYDHRLIATGELVGMQ